jgi:hypothetical protein
MTFVGGAFKERGTQTREGDWQGTSQSAGKESEEIAEGSNFFARFVESGAAS